MKPLTAQSVIDPASIRKRIQIAKERGYAIIADETVLGDISVASSIADEHGRAIAGISISVPTTRWTIERVEAELVKHVQLRTCFSSRPNRWASAPNARSSSRTAFPAYKLARRHRCASSDSQGAVIAAPTMPSTCWRPELYWWPLMPRPCWPFWRRGLPRRFAHGLDQVVHRAGREALDIGLLDHRGSAFSAIATRSLRRLRKATRERLSCRRATLLHGTDRRQLDDLAEATARSIGDPDFPAVPADDLAGDRQPETGTGDLLATGPVGTEERFEHLI